MPDPYATIDRAPDALQTRLADVLELRATDRRQQEMLAEHLAGLDLPPNARVLEVGCGTGPISRTVAALPNVGHVVGVDPSPVFVRTARELSSDREDVSFEVGDGRALPFADEEFDAVVFHTTLCHIPEPERALAEAVRVLKSGGLLVIFDGDYTTATVAVREHDPLQVAVEVMVRNFVENPWLIRSLPAVLGRMGLTLERFGSHGYTMASNAAYMLTLVDRGTELLVAAGTLSEPSAAALRDEARRRNDAGEFFGHISYVSAVARK